MSFMVRPPSLINWRLPPRSVLSLMSERLPTPTPVAYIMCTVSHDARDY